MKSRRRYAAAILALLSSTAGVAHADAVTAVDWDSATTGVLGSTSVTLSNLTPFGTLTRSYTGSDYSQAPLSNVEAINYPANSSWAATFSNPVNLLLYVDVWRGPYLSNQQDPPTHYTFSSPFTIVSGLGGASVSGDTLTLVDNDQFFNGIIRFSGPVSSLSVTSDGPFPFGQIMTFAKLQTPAFWIGPYAGNWSNFANWTSAPVDTDVYVGYDAAKYPSLVPATGSFLAVLDKMATANNLYIAPNAILASSGAAGFTSEVLNQGTLATNSGSSLSLSTLQISNGTLLVGSNSSLSTALTSIGGTPGKFGSAWVSGTKAQWTSSDQVVLGDSTGSAGYLNISNGGAGNFPQLILGGSTASSANLTISGLGKLAVTNDIVAGAFGDGTVQIVGAGTITSKNLVAGLDAGARGLIQLPGGTVQLSGDLTAGDAGVGTVSISGTAQVTAGRLVAGISSSGTINIFGSAQVTSSGMYITPAGNAPGSGTVDVGGGSVMLAISGGQVNLGEGDNSNAYMKVHDGAHLIFTSPPTSASEGFITMAPLYETGKATLVATDPGTMISTSALISVGSAGAATFEILNGATVHSSPLPFSLIDPTDSGRIARDAGSSGTLIVSGIGSVWQNTGSLDFGKSGNAHASVMSGGALESVGGALAQFLGSTGSVMMSGAGSHWTVSDSLYVGGTVAAKGGAATLTVTNGATLSVGNSLVTWDDAVVDITGGKAVIGGGGLPANPGTLRVGTGGTLAGTGTITGDVLTDGGIVSPGHSPGVLTIDGDLDLGDGLLKIEIAGSDAGDFDQIIVNGIATLGGTLEIDLLNGFIPAPGTQFDFLNAAGISPGSQFNSIILPGSVQWDLSQLQVDGSISVVPEPSSMIVIVVLLSPLSGRRRCGNSARTCQVHYRVTN